MSPYRIRRWYFFLRGHLKSRIYDSLVEREDGVVVSTEAARGIIRNTAEMLERLRKNLVCLCSACHLQQILRID
jgi:hypothetical protein